MLSNQKTRVLVVDDDAAMAKFLSSYLARRNFDSSTASSGEEAIRMFRVYDPVLVLLDVSMPGMSGLETLERLKQIKPEVLVIILSGQSNPEIIFRASKSGADDYIAKPFEPKDLEVRINKVLEKQQIVNEVTQLRDQVRRQSDFSMLFGTSPKMEDVKNTIEQVADTNATVLIRGESGTGKEVVARMVYGNSGRRESAFVKVNCAAIPHELLESELFGYEPGAFTGANRQKLGKFDQANNGTIFLDEISEMHPALQAKLLHVLQDGEFARLGGKRDIAVDVRVLAATNKPLERAVEEGMFREDLFYRLNVVTDAHPTASRASRGDTHLPRLLPAQVQRVLREESAGIQRLRCLTHDGVQLAGQHSRTGKPCETVRHRRQRAADHPRAVDAQADSVIDLRNQPALGSQGRHGPRSERSLISAAGGSSSCTGSLPASPSSECQG